MKISCCWEPQILYAPSRTMASYIQHILLFISWLLWYILHFVLHTFMKRILASIILASVALLSTSTFASTDFSYTPTTQDQEVIENVGQKLDQYLFHVCKDQSVYTCQRVVSWFFRALRRLGATSQKMHYITESIIPNLAQVQNPLFSITTPTVWNKLAHTNRNGCDYLWSWYVDTNDSVFWNPHVTSANYDIPNSDVDECIEFAVKRISSYEYESAKALLDEKELAKNYTTYDKWGRGGRELLYPWDGAFSPVFMVKYPSSIYGNQHYQVSLIWKIFQDGIECERMSDCYNKKTYTETNELRDIIKNTLSVK